MGRITIFTLNACGHCNRAKAALTSRHIPYTEINLSTHPAKRNDMLKLAGRLSVPQVFFNERHIGGAEETLALLEMWDSVGDGEALGHYETEVARDNDPTDPRLLPPTGPGIAEPKAPDRPNMKSIVTPSGDCVSVLDITETLKKILPLEELKHNLTMYKHCCRGVDAVTALCLHYSITPQQAEDFGNRLMQAQVLHHVCFDHDFANTQAYYYRLQCHQTPHILNSYRIWTERADTENPMALVQRLQKLLAKVESEASNEKGNVDYVRASQLTSFIVFEEEVCELQLIDLSEMDETTRTAYCINVYNLFIKFAFIKVGIGTTTATRGAFFSNVEFNLGGTLFSFGDLEHGVLRGNSKAPYTLSVPFGRRDPRLALSIKPGAVDSRLHFALNCGANSCPPVKQFTAQALDEELRIVAASFCEQDEHVRIDSSTHTLYLSMILYWYRVDFAPSNSKLPSVLLQHLRGEKKQALQALMDTDKPLSVKFLDYDWSTNASDFVPFDSSCLKANDKTILNVLHHNDLSCSDTTKIVELQT